MCHSALIFRRIAGVTGSLGLDGTPASYLLLPTPVEVLSLYEGLPYLEISVDIVLLTNMIWQFGDVGPPVSKRPQIDTVCSPTLAEVVHPHVCKNLCISFCLHHMSCGWRGLSLLGIQATNSSVQLLNIQFGCFTTNSHRACSGIGVGYFCASGTTCKN